MLMKDVGGETPGIARFVRDPGWEVESQNTHFIVSLGSTFISHPVLANINLARS
jgi:hypothetical protein